MLYIYKLALNASFANQLATRGVKGTSDFPGEIVETPAEEIENEEEFVMNDGSGLGRIRAYRSGYSQGKGSRFS
jgi:hypothetical protein